MVIRSIIYNTSQTSQVHLVPSNWELIRDLSWASSKFYSIWLIRWSPVVFLLLRSVRQSTPEWIRVHSPSVLITWWVIITDWEKRVSWSYTGRWTIRCRKTTHSTFSSALLHVFRSVQVVRIFDQVQFSSGLSDRPQVSFWNLTSGTGRFSSEEFYAEPNQNIENKWVQIIVLFLELFWNLNCLHLC